MKKIPLFGTAGLLQLIMGLERTAEIVVIAIIVATWMLFIIETLKESQS